MSSELQPTPPAPLRGLDALIWAPSTAFTRALERWRYVFFVLLIVFLLIPFNGQWRIGLDSSIYRGVAQSLATGHGYAFAGRPQTQVYPGLPFLLAVIQRATGSESVVPPLVLMNLMSIATIFIVYRLILLRYPVWIAVAVTCGVALNARFIQQAQELMTDTPFLLGCVTAMYGWERLSVVNTRRGIVTSTLILLTGLFIAATMRPTFWVLAVAWVLSAGWNIVWRREKRSMIAMVALGAVLCLFMLIDPRFHGFNLLQGSYEQQFVQNLSTLGEHVAQNAPALFKRELCEAFFGEPMAWLGPYFSVLLLIGAAIVTYRQPVWGLQVFILTAIMLLLSEIPRYYLMVLPTLWLGYILLALVIFQKLIKIQRDVLLFVLFSLANFMNCGAIVMSLIPEQHSSNFLHTYRHGAYVPYLKLADSLRARMAPTDNAIGPMGQVLSFLSGRNVLNGKLLGFETQGVMKEPGIVAAADPKYLVGPINMYDSKDQPIYRMLAHGVIVPGKLLEIIELPHAVDSVDGGDKQKIKEMWISKLTVETPTADWRKQPTTRPHPLADRPPKHVPTAEQLAHRAAVQHRQMLQERADRAAARARRLRRQRKSATQSAPDAATQPSSILFPRDHSEPTNFLMPLFASATLQPGLRFNSMTE